MRAHTVAKLKVKKPADKLCFVKVLVRVEMLAYILAQKNGKILAKNHGNIWKLKHWSRRWLTG